MLSSQRQDRTGEEVLCLAVETSASLLRAEDEAHTCSRLSRALVGNGLSVTSAGSSVAARTAATASFAYVVTGCGSLTTAWS